MAKLTDAALKGLRKKPGRHGDDGGLYFRVLPGRKAYWAYRYRVNGKEREMSLGVYPDIGLAKARDRRDIERAKVRTHKIDPLAEKRAGKARTTVPTFGKAADDYIAARQASWKTAAYRAQWKNSLWTYCAAIRDLPVDQIDTEAVLRVLQPIWNRKPAVASMLRGRVEAVIDAAWARARGHIDANRANPARWRGHLAKILPKPAKLTRGHHAAMSYADVPAFMAKLRSSEHTAAKALALDILCAARPDEVLGMTWDEVPFAAAVELWTVPAERMKMEVEHQVPLSNTAVAILRERQATRRPKEAYVFPGARPGRPLSASTLKRTMRRLCAGKYTVHGFRSSFRDWAADHGVEFEVAEQCLAHKVGNSVTRAYLRSTMLERRRKVMADWAAFLAGKAGEGDVIPFMGKRRKGDNAAD